MRSEVRTLDADRSARPDSFAMGAYTARGDELCSHIEQWGSSRDPDRQAIRDERRSARLAARR
jgi:hypothetical protein